MWSVSIPDPLVATGRSMVARTAHFTHTAAQAGSDQQGPSGYGLRTGHATGCAGVSGNVALTPTST